MITNDEQYKILEEKQKIKSNETIQNINARKEKEKAKREKQTRLKRAKWILYDEIMKKSKDVKDLNALLYDENIKDIIIENAINNLFNQLKNVSDELQEDINLYLLDNYNVLASKVISIKTKERKELQRQEEERQAQELQDFLIRQGEQIQKEQEKQKEEQAKRQRIENAIAILQKIIVFLFHPLVAIPLLILGIIITILVNVFNIKFFSAIGFTILGIFILLILYKK